LLQAGRCQSAAELDRIKSIGRGLAGGGGHSTWGLNPVGLDSILRTMTNEHAVRVSGLLGATGVALGAFGAHALKAALVRNQMAEVWETAVFYHFVHALLLLALAFRRPLLKGPWLTLLLGVALFSGSLYGLAFTGIRWLGAITPMGGVCLMAGWLWLAYSAARTKADPPV
jgi:uncharacterized membrane protein YgdD (TMEM256/DUF423 family)